MQLAVKFGSLLNVESSEPVMDLIVIVYPKQSDLARESVNMVLCSFAVGLMVIATCICRTTSTENLMKFTRGRMVIE